MILFSSLCCRIKNEFPGAGRSRRKRGRYRNESKGMRCVFVIWKAVKKKKKDRFSISFLPRINDNVTVNFLHRNVDTFTRNKRSAANCTKQVNGGTERSSLRVHGYPCSVGVEINLKLIELKLKYFDSRNMLRSRKYLGYTKI